MPEECKKSVRRAWGCYGANRMSDGVVSTAGRGRFTLVAAAHLFLLDGERVLLSLRHNTGYADGQWSVVAGHLDGDETAVMAISREAREEAGIAIAPDDLAVVGIMHRRAAAPSEQERLDFFLTARVWSGVPSNQEPEKCAALAWYPLDALPPRMVPYVRRALANYRQGRWFDTFGWEDGVSASTATPPR